MNAIRGSIDRMIGNQGPDDPVVLEAMLAEYSAPVYRLALSVLRDEDDAQDAVQDTFIQASAGLKLYQVGTNFKAWLLTIALNNCRMTLRKRRTRQALQHAWEIFVRSDNRQPGVEAQLVQAETRSELWNLVDALDEKHRLVVILRLAHDLTISEISQVLGINEKTVYTRLYTAFTRLRSQIRLKPEYAHLWEEVLP